MHVYFGGVRILKVIWDVENVHVGRVFKAIDLYLVRVIERNAVVQTIERAFIATFIH